MAVLPLPGGGKRFQVRARRGAGSALGGPKAGASSPAPAAGGVEVPQGSGVVARESDPGEAEAIGIRGCWLLPVTSSPERLALSVERLGQGIWFRVVIRPPNTSYGLRGSSENHCNNNLHIPVQPTICGWLSERDLPHRVVHRNHLRTSWAVLRFISMPGYN